MSFLRFALCLLTIAASTTGTLHAADFEPHEVEAEFLLRFGAFVTFPEKFTPARGAPLIVGVVGESPFGSALGALAEDREIKGHPVVTRQLSAFPVAEPVHVLYIATSEEDRAAEIVAEARKHGMLTVGSFPGFLALGGTIEMRRLGDTYRFDVSQKSAKSAGLTVSSKLLRVAEAVHR